MTASPPAAPSGGPAPLVIVGPTASGKTALALALARLVADQGRSVEIVSADAMAVYRGMDIGTAKPDRSERRAVPHHLIDVVDPGYDFTVAEFQRLALDALAAIEARAAMPIVVGGTGLYVRTVVDEFTMPGQFPAVRAELENEPDTEALWSRLDRLDPVAAARMLPTNRRRIVRALEVSVGSGRPFSSFGPGVDQYPPSRFVQVGLDIDRAELDRRIDRRYEAQVEAGLVAEVERLLAVGPSRTAAQALGYKELFDHLRGRSSLDEALTEARRRTKRFARRQQRWFRRDPRIRWFDATAPDLVALVAHHWRAGAEAGAGPEIE